MKHKIRKCRKCNIYTMKEKCPICGDLTVTAHPAPFSPDDRYLIYKIKIYFKKN
ncbi:RNA-protein complex protein Nop10 [Candidatus Geothermarchaeota archaeon]|nr:MAG: RNA-protein complex protein Nop10 [Candidatus Geothermarchaeota archaeon]HEW93887.1 RNA-protein complex protein Nop10 [Thermoprotei archaeon]